jgi:hypothetical protein
MKPRYSIGDHVYVTNPKTGEVLYPDEVVQGVFEIESGVYGYALLGIHDIVFPENTLEYYDENFDIFDEIDDENYLRMSVEIEQHFSFGDIVSFGNEPYTVESYQFITTFYSDETSKTEIYYTIHSLLEGKTKNVPQNSLILLAIEEDADKFKKQYKGKKVAKSDKQKIDNMLDAYNQLIQLHNLTGDEHYKSSAADILKKLKRGQKSTNLDKYFIYRDSEIEGE